MRRISAARYLVPNHRKRCRRTFIDEVAFQGLQLAKNGSGLTRERHDVCLAHLHALGWNAPLGAFKVEFGPLRCAQFARTHEDTPKMPEDSVRV
jgi:hypothetical protein